VKPVWRLRLAGVALVWERLWPACWPLTALVLGFLVIAAFDLLPILPAWLHMVVLLLTGLLGLAAVWVAATGVRLPSSAEMRRRLEQDSGLPHRPLATLDDRPAGAGNDPFAAALWQAHQRRMQAASGDLRWVWPHAGLVERDPYGLRVMLSLLLFLGLLSSGGDFGRRLDRALAPSWAGAPPIAAAGFDLWITPPDYTGLPPIYRGTAVASGGDTAKSATISVPAGSTVVARVHGGGSIPGLALDARKVPFEALNPGEYSLKSPIGDAQRLSLSQGGSELAAYAISIIPDRPPSAAWTGPAHVLARGTLRLDYQASDDYGVSGLAFEIKRPTGDEPPVTITLTAPPQLREIKSSVFEDLTASDWAGLPVELTLIATDAIGQTGRSAPQVLKLPERSFRNPVAKAVIEQRKLLRHDPTQADIVAETLSDLSLQAGLYHGDSTVFLGLRSAARRLQLDPAQGASPETKGLLWDLAVRIEDGDVPESQKTLREAEQALKDALDRNAPDAEVERLMTQLEQAVQRYLQALTAEAGQSPPQESGGGREVGAQDIQKMLDEARKLAGTGAKDAAKQALNNLQDLLESLRAGKRQGGQGSAQSQALQDLARKQLQLLDKSYSAARRKNDGAEGAPGDAKQGRPRPGQDGDLAGEQEGLRKQLSEMMKKLGEQGELPQAFSRADRAMRGAGKALQQGEPGDAVGSESEALDQLQQGAREMAEKQGQGQGQGGSQQAGGTDPFGRNGSGQIDNGGVKLPAGIDLQRSREILDELRRRAGEADRPALERDYLNRLLQRF
jgi:uncharacterized protein (TIGR02302 family)